MDYEHTSTTLPPRARVWVAIAKIPTAGYQSNAFSTREKAEAWLMKELQRSTGKLEVRIEHYFVDEK